tara:strand:+ start:51 stop:368 length:318 start_codon:yes stop_codon:yes gene_type:complete
MIQGKHGVSTKRKDSTLSVLTSLRTGHARQALGPLLFVSLMVLLSGLILAAMYLLETSQQDLNSLTNPCHVSQTLASQVLTQRYQSENPHLRRNFGQTECTEMGK